MSRCTGKQCPMQLGYDRDNCKITRDCPYITRPATNGDMVRAMTDEELAVLFAILRADLARFDAPVRPYNGLDVNRNYEWLQQPWEDKT